MYIAYSLLLVCAALVSLPWWLAQLALRARYRAGLSERLGHVSRRLQPAAPGSIWVHAVSVGEVLAVSRLVEELRKAHPERQVFVSTTTATGQRLARDRFGEDHVFYLPLDFGFALRPYMAWLQPSLLVLAETEFWPNLLHQAKKSGAAVAIVNARISDRSFPRYRRFRWFFARVLGDVDLFLAQTEQDAQRLREIGAPAAGVQVSGNLKFDVRPSANSGLVEKLRLAFRDKSPVIVCGSTTDGEEEMLLAAFQQVLQQAPAAVMVLAPRRPERFEKVATLVTSMNLGLQRRSAWDGHSPCRSHVFLLDSIGELASAYALADLAFVGGSLVPAGGHNILEPAQHGVAVLTGPYTFNFREMVSIFEQDGGLREVAAENLADQIIALLRNGQERSLLGQRAKELFARYAGATARTLAGIEPLLVKEKKMAVRQ